MFNLSKKAELSKKTNVGICKIHLKIPGKFDKLNI